MKDSHPFFACEDSEAGIEPEDASFGEGREVSGWAKKYSRFVVAQRTRVGSEDGKELTLFLEGKR